MTEFSIEKIDVKATERVLKAEYTMEIPQDLNNLFEIDEYTDQDLEDMGKIFMEANCGGICERKEREDAIWAATVSISQG